MKTYQVVLSKSYIITIKAQSDEQAKRMSEFYTSDIKDLSTNKDRLERGFSIEEIESGINEALEVGEVASAHYI